MTKYLPKIKVILDALVEVGEKIRDVELALLVLAGLGEEYVLLVQNVTSRSDKVTYKMLRIMLTDIEVCQCISNVINSLSLNVVENLDRTVKSGNTVKTNPIKFVRKENMELLTVTIESI